MSFMIGRATHMVDARGVRLCNTFCGLLKTADPAKVDCLRCLRKMKLKKQKDQDHEQSKDPERKQEARYQG